MSENESAVTEVGTFEVFFDEVEFDATEDVLRYTKSTRLRFGGGRISPELLGLTLALPSGRRSAIDRYRVTIERLPHEVKP